MNATIYNCHTHIFNMDCAPRNFLYARIPRLVAKPLIAIIKTKAGAKALKWILKTIGYSSENVEKLYGFFRIGMHNTQDLVFEELMTYYPEGTRFVALTLNMDYMGAGIAERNFLTQVDNVVAIRQKYPQQLLPFLSIDPRFGTASELLALCHKYIFNPKTLRMGGFVGIKLYPSLGFYPFDPKLNPVYEFAQRYQIPIMTHCTKEGIQAVDPEPLPINQIIPPFAPNDFVPFVDPTKPNLKNVALCDNFLYPPFYEYVLKKFPYLKICFAHFGGEDEIKKSNDPKSWYNLIKEIILNPNYYNVYTDISYTLYDSKANAIIKQDLLQPLLKERILFGTDFFMTVIEKDEKKLWKEAQRDYQDADFFQMATINPFTRADNTPSQTTVSTAIVEAGFLYQSYLKSRVYQ